MLFIASRLRSKTTILCFNLGYFISCSFFPLMKKEPKKSRLPIVSLNSIRNLLSCPDGCILRTLSRFITFELLLKLEYVGICDYSSWCSSGVENRFSWVLLDSARRSLFCVFNLGYFISCSFFPLMKKEPKKSRLPIISLNSTRNFIIVSKPLHS